MNRPPAFAEWITARLLQPDEREAVLGDLHEEYLAHVRAVPATATPDAGTGVKRGLPPFPTFGGVSNGSTPATT